MEILIILFLFLLNGLFAMSEIALVSSKRARIQQKADEGISGAKTALNLMNDPARFLSTVQIGITLVGIVAGAYGGEAFMEDLKPLFDQLDWLRPYSGEISFLLIVAVISYFSLVIGELVPKTIALNNPEAITIALAPVMQGLSRITYPFVYFLSASTRIFLKIFRIKQRENPPVTEEELRALIDSGTRYGIIEKQEREIMQGVFRFGDKNAYTLMTPRREIFWVDINKSKEEILHAVHQTHYSKFPICNGSLDQVLGVVTVKDVLTLADTDPSFNLNTILREVVFIPSVMPALKVLDLFRRKRIHFGFILDEFGVVEGLVTLHDLVENIMGDMPEFENDPVAVVKREDGSFLADADMRISEIQSLLGIKNFPGEQSYSTLAGFVVYQLERIPKVGDHLIYGNYTFEVIDMDGNRIDKVLIVPSKSK